MTREDADTQQEDGPVKTEAEIGGLPPPGTERLGPPEAGRGGEGSSLAPSEGMWPCRLLDFGLLDSGP